MQGCADCQGEDWEAAIMECVPLALVTLRTLLTIS